ncbi:alpha/beta fold hydrolase [Frondihabitans australicus]|uniref:Pimeloyl-ACP methyl ester carboxylesterase n=1 Tax=Frondihabitans australicus TaxID=386892 RepID=A0A495ID74_9MICO|nr:alpha/beta hydrolase [Frondihabitans australicus]RKR73580.1 pimeloyl-ACP methyl ester carboxylesterase [Frondihabitans australicus]
MTDIETLTLPDSRLLDYRVSGPADGVPLVFHHGTPGSVLPITDLEEAAHARGLRFVTYSRAGYGGSGRNAGRRVVDVVPDIQAVLAAIGAESAVVAGWSGGGPHSLASAARLPGVKAALVIAGVAPYGRPDLDFLAGMGDDNLDEFGAALESEAAVRTYLDKAREGLVDVAPGDIVREMASLLPDVDRAVLTDRYADEQAANFREALRVSADGWIDDDLAFITDWGFDLDEIDVPTFLWQGTADLMVPVSHGRWFEQHLPRATVTILPDEGHPSISLGAVDAMLDQLVAAAGL